VSSIRLRDASGHVVTLASLRGKTLVISDSMTLCSEDCPLDTANIVAAARAADADGATHQVEFLTITVDPRRDDARHLSAYRRLYDPRNQLPNWQLLTGSPRQIARLWKYFGVYWHRVPQGNPPDHDWLTGRPLTYDVQHADEVLLVDPGGYWRFVISGHAHVRAPRGVPARMRAFLSSEGRRHLERPSGGTWTYGDVLQALSWLRGQPLSSS
jgi:protein SCO1/2